MRGEDRKLSNYWQRWHLTLISSISWPQDFSKKYKFLMFLSTTEYIYKLLSSWQRFCHWHVHNLLRNRQYSQYTNDLTIGYQNWNLLSHPNARTTSATSKDKWWNFELLAELLVLYPLVWSFQYTKVCRDIQGCLGWEVVSALVAGDSKDCRSLYWGCIV